MRHHHCGDVKRVLQYYYEKLDMNLHDIDITTTLIVWWLGLKIAWEIIFALSTTMGFPKGTTIVIFYYIL